MKAFLLNLIITFQGFVALYDGNMRNRFIENFADFASPQYHNAQTIEMLLIIISVLMILISITSNLSLKVVSIFASIAHSCFCYNVAKYHDTQSLTILISQVIVIFMALDANIDVLISKERQEKQKVDKLVKEILKNQIDEVQKQSKITPQKESSSKGGSKHEKKSKGHK